MHGNPTIRHHHPFNANADAERLKNAIESKTNETFIDVLCRRSNSQRQEIAETFKVQYGKDLAHELKAKLSGDFEVLVLALLESSARFDAEQLHKAIAGAGTKESVIIEIMTTRSNDEIRRIKRVYEEMYDHSLEQDLKGDTSGPFQNLLVSLCIGERDEHGHVDSHKANLDAHKLFHAGGQSKGIDQAVFNEILTSQNYSQLCRVFEEYEKIANHSIDTGIEKEFKGDMRAALLSIVKSIRNRTAYFAELLYNSMKGLGTRDTDLIRLIVSRSEIDLRDISQAYHQRYEKSLEDAIKSECSGAYKDGLIAIVKGNH
jgi:annexin A7/11